MKKKKKEKNVAVQIQIFFFPPVQRRVELPPSHWLTDRQTHCDRPEAEAWRRGNTNFFIPHLHVKEMKPSPVSPVGLWLQIHDVCVMS